MLREVFGEAFFKGVNCCIHHLAAGVNGRLSLWSVPGNSLYALDHISGWKQEAAGNGDRLTTPVTKSGVFYLKKRAASEVSLGRAKDVKV